MSDDTHALDWYPDPDDERPVSLVLIDKARAALAEARTLSDIGAVMDVAQRAREYAVAAKLGIEAENIAASLWLDSARAAGALLAETAKHRGGWPEPASCGHKMSPQDAPPTLAELGITKRQSSDWQAIARLPDDEYREIVDGTIEAQRPLRLGGLVDAARKLTRAERRAERMAEPVPDGVYDSLPARIEVGAAAMMRQPSETVHLIVTSPPYAVGVDYAGGDIAPDAWPTFMLRWLADAYRVAVDHGRLAVNVPLDTTQGDYRPTYAQTIEAAIRAGWRYRSSIVWLDDHLGKSTARGSVDSAVSPSIIAGVEMVALFSKGDWRRASSVPSDLTRDEWVAWTNGVWRLGGEGAPWEDHPAAFPVELPRRLIRLLSFPGDTVLDPFVGSGTTAVAAVELGRAAIGFDRSQEYVDSARRRLVAHRGRSRTVGATDARDGVRGSFASEVLAG